MTTRQLADILVRAGVVQPQAVEDPEGYDNCETLGRIAEAATLVTVAEARETALQTEAVSE